MTRLLAAAAAVLSLLLMAGLMLTACGPAHSPPSASSPPPQRPTPTEAPAQPSSGVAGPALSQINREPIVRVRLEHGADTVTLDAAGPIVVGPGRRDIPAEPRRFVSPVTFRRVAGDFVLTDGRGRSVRWALPVMRVTPSEGAGAGLRLDGNRYPGAMHLVPTPGQPRARFDLVNHVGLETYLPGVLHRELLPGWDLTTFKSQAIAARSYALWEMNRDRDRHYDLTAGTGSQVYGGDSAAKPRQAVAETRGQVLGYQGRVTPAFFSSTCGGTAQNAAAIFGDRTPAIRPLSGHPPATWCRNSRHYRWGPVQRSTASVARRVAAWGQTRDHPVASLRSLDNLQIARRSSTGRPAAFVVTDRSLGRQFMLGAEQMRFALNQSAPGLAELPDKQRVMSSHFVPSVAGGSLIVRDGRGWGHGVGMCQYGAQAMAQSGYNPQQILGFYYPGASITPLYR